MTPAWKREVRFLSESGPFHVTAAGLLFGFLPDVENISVVRSVGTVMFDLLPHQGGHADRSRTVSLLSRKSGMRAATAA